jgi:DNA (cytosine-5)-methyltransferase 1
MKIRTLDLFSGCGGSSHGARKAGATIVAAVDAWDLATQTYQQNFPEVTVVTKRLEDVRVRAFHDAIGDVDLMLASPECTNHTCAKGSVKRSEASRKTALEVLRFAEEFLPRWIVIENVIQMRKWRRYPGFLSRLATLGYQTQEQVLNARDFGVPQSRRRLFVLCDRDSPPPAILRHANGSAKPAKNILDDNGAWGLRPLFAERRASNTIVRYLTGLERVGESVPFLLVYYGTDACGGWQRLDRPLRTVTTVDRFALINSVDGEPQIRMLQVPELQRAMGFESDFRIDNGTRRERIKLLGNAVCPPVMEAVVRTLTRSTRQDLPANRNTISGRG